MAREQEFFREQMAQLNVIFPGVGVLKTEQIATYLQKSTRTIQRQFKGKLVDGCVSKEVLAKWMCQTYK